MLDPEDPDFEDSDFFESFGPAFKRNARWSVKKPIPDIGDRESTEKQVDDFYRFWQRFQSWRELTHEDEFDLEEAECREDRRYMQVEKDQSTATLHILPFPVSLLSPAPLFPCLAGEKA